MQDGRNGRLLAREDEASFAEALRSIAAMGAAEYRALSEAARATSEPFAIDHFALRVMSLYNQLLRDGRRPREAEENAWAQVLRLLETEWDLWGGRVGAAVKSIGDSL